MSSTTPTPWLVTYRTARGGRSRVTILASSRDAALTDPRLAYVTVVDAVPTSRQSTR